MDYFVVLHEKQLDIIKQIDLMPIQTYKAKKISNFCLNEEVYRGASQNRNVSSTDQICIVSSGTLFFLEAERSVNQYKFVEDTKPERKKGFQIGVSPEQLVWDGDKIYMACKRSQSFRPL